MIRRPNLIAAENDRVVIFRGNASALRETLARKLQLFRNEFLKAGAAANSRGSFGEAPRKAQPPISQAQDFSRKRNAAQAREKKNRVSANQILGTVIDDLDFVSELFQILLQRVSLQNRAVVVRGVKRQYACFHDASKNCLIGKAPASEVSRAFPRKRGCGARGGRRNCARGAGTAFS